MTKDKKEEKKTVALHCHNTSKSMFLQAQGKINLCQLDKPVETLREPSNQDLVQ